MSDARYQVVFITAADAGQAARIASTLVEESLAACVNIIDADIVDGEIVRRMIRAVNPTPYNLAKHEHYLTVAERIVAAHRETQRGREE